MNAFTNGLSGLIGGAFDEVEDIINVNDFIELSDGAQIIFV